MTNKVVTWEDIQIRLGDLTPWKKNPKTISKGHAKRLLALWKKIGQFQNLAIGPGGEIYDGHQRYFVLLAAYGEDYIVSAKRSSRALTDEERKEIIIAAHFGTVGTFRFEDVAEWNEINLVRWGLDSEALSNAGNDYGAILAILDVAQQDQDPDDPFSDFGKTAANEGYVTFQFGDYRGRVEQETYDSFVRMYREIKSEMGGEPMITDVLKRWLNV